MAESEANVPGPASLPYATPLARVPWGPIAFRPSRGALILLALAGACATWLALRHHPWREVARLPSSYYEGPPFTADGRVLTMDPDRGANLWDPADGSLIRNVLPKVDTGTYRYFIVKGGTRILALPHNEKTAVVYEVGTGAVAARLQNPLALSWMATVYPDGSRVITQGILRAAAPGGLPTPTTMPATPAERAAIASLVKLHVWDISGPDQPSPPKSLQMSLDFRVSADGSRLLLVERPYLILRDARSLEKLSLNRMTPGRLFGFATNDLYYLEIPRPLIASSDVWKVIELRSARDGGLVRSVWLKSAVSAGFGPEHVAVSSDARHLMRLRVAGGAPPGRLRPGTFQTWDLHTSKLVETRRAAEAPITFFPKSSRYVTAEPARDRAAVFEPGRARPLAILPGEGGSLERGRLDAFISPDGRTIALPGGPNEQWLWVYRRAGSDCPESHAGAIAFPQTWLTVVGFAAAGVALFRGALHRGTGAASAGLATVVLAVSLAPAAYVLVCACLGEWRQAMWLAPAGIMPVVAIGLALGSRFWRLAGLCAFAAGLPYVLWLAYRVWGAGPKRWTVYPLLDRHYDVPHLPVLVGLGGVAVLLGTAIVLLARSTRGPAGA